MENVGHSRNARGIMLIRELAKKTGVSPKTIRYYESIGLMPPPERGDNNYRQYTTADVERLRFIASTRSLDFSLSDIGEILAARNDNIPPCEQVLDTLDHRLEEIDRRIADMLSLRDAIRQIRAEGEVLPKDDVQGEECVCYLIKSYHQTGEVTIEQTKE
jgi:DNA-binding transcriptional MerR regulator